MLHYCRTFRSSISLAGTDSLRTHPESQPGLTKLGAERASSRFSVTMIRCSSIACIMWARQSGRRLLPDSRCIDHETTVDCGKPMTACADAAAALSYSDEQPEAPEDAAIPNPGLSAF